MAKNDTKVSVGLTILLAATGVAVASNGSNLAPKHDEFTGNLDANQKTELLDLLRDLNAEVKDWKVAGPTQQPSRCYTT